jgi:YHS domain-containing protein
MAIDPVCGMKVDERTEKLKTTYKDKTYYFCSEPCLKQFRAKPEKFVK